MNRPFSEMDMTIGTLNPTVPPTSNPVALGLPAFPRFAKQLETTMKRATVVTGAILALVLVVVLVLWHELTAPDPAIDSAFYHFIASSRKLSRLANSDVLKYAYGTFMFVLLMMLPLATVAAYWFALRRLYQERLLRVWLKTLGLSVALMLTLLAALGAAINATATAHNYATLEFGNRFWSLVMLAYYPMLIALIAFAALATSAVGVAFAKFFAQWPLERIRNLQSQSMLDFLLVFFTGFLGLMAQYFLYQALDRIPLLTQWFWSLPLAALLIAAYACGSAIWPPRQQQQFQPSR